MPGDPVNMTIEELENGRRRISICRRCGRPLFYTGVICDSGLRCLTCCRTQLELVFHRRQLTGRSSPTGTKTSTLALWILWCIAHRNGYLLFSNHTAIGIETQTRDETYRWFHPVFVFVDYLATRPILSNSLYISTS